MAARRCGLCSVNYPLVVLRCHICGDKLATMEDENPDPDWREDVARKKFDPDSGEDERVVCWRRHELQNAGYDSHDAELIAARHAGPDAVDLHRAVELLEHGCPERLAVEILL